LRICLNYSDDLVYLTGKRIQLAQRQNCHHDTQDTNHDQKRCRESDSSRCMSVPLWSFAVEAIAGIAGHGIPLLAQ
jgi:hypothetical protein